jgi:hypothetical protein
MQDPAKEAREDYNKIGRIWSVALNDYISFNNVGFQHLIRKGKAPRSPRQQIKRLTLIPYATEVILKPSQPVTLREEEKYSPIKRDGIEMMINTHVRFWAFHANIENKNIRVIVRQINNGHKHFFSIFEEDKQKRPRE